MRQQEPGEHEICGLHLAREIKHVGAEHFAVRPNPASGLVDERLGGVDADQPLRRKHFVC